MWKNTSCKSAVKSGPYVQCGLLCSHQENVCKFVVLVVVCDNCNNYYRNVCVEVVCCDETDELLH